MRLLIILFLLFIGGQVFAAGPDGPIDDPLCDWPKRWDDHCGDPPIDWPPGDDDRDYFETVEDSNAEIRTMDLYINPYLSDCTDYCFEGTCFWLKCAAFFCSIKTSIRVSHWQPDLVVSSYKELAKNPWKEAQDLWGSLQEDFAETQMGWVNGALSGSLGGGQETPENAQNMHDDGGQRASLKNFREVDAIGYPFPFHWQGFDELFCPSQATMFMPHFSSAFDAFNWRMGIMELPYFFKIFTDPIGYTFVMEWGSVYPRIGSAMQKEDAKMSALAAQRAADIVTRNGQPHIYMPVTGNPGQGFKYFKTPGPAEINTSEHKWQMFAPKKDNSCYRFDPIAENFQRSEQWLENRVKLDGAGVYALWRGRYECCKDRGKYLFSVQVRICL